MNNFLNTFKKTLLTTDSVLLSQIREKAKKASGCTRNSPKSLRPKHKGWKRQDGSYVSRGTILATQNTLKWHPGLNVGFGHNGTLFALEHGQVVVTCEQIKPNWDHTWIQRCYAGRQDQIIHKKHFNVIPQPQHNRFKLIDEV